MLLEHAVYTAALCVIAGMLYEGYTNRNPVWIIWFAMLIPDTDYIVENVWVEMFPTKIVPIIHGSFHNFFTLTVISLIAGWLIWKTVRVPFKDAAFCVALGFGAHMLEDALCNGVFYYFYVPFSNRPWYQGYIIHPANDVFFANTVLFSTNLAYIGIALLVLVILIRCIIQGFNWLDRYVSIPRGMLNWVCRVLEIERTSDLDQVR